MLFVCLYNVNLNNLILKKTTSHQELQIKNHLEYFLPYLIFEGNL